MIRIAICDDDVEVLGSVYQAVQAYAEQSPQEEYMVRRFQSVYDLLECLENPDRHFHIYFLDIIMPMYNGIELGRLIRAQDDNAVIIYMTTSKEYSFVAYENTPLAYLIKPIDQQKVDRVLNEARKRLESTAGRHLIIKLKDGLTNIGLHRIEYVEYSNHALIFYQKNDDEIKSRILRESFSSFFERVFNDARFIKPHASYAVNMDHVETLTSKGFIMSSGAAVPVAKRQYTQVKQQYVDYILAKNGVEFV